MSSMFEAASFIGEWAPAKHIMETLNWLVYELIEKNKELKDTTYEYFNGTETVTARYSPVMHCNSKPAVVAGIVKSLDSTPNANPYEIIIPYKVDTNVLHYLWLIMNAVALEKPEDNIIPAYIQSIESSFGTVYDSFIKSILESQVQSVNFTRAVANCISGAPRLADAQNTLIKKAFCYTAIAIYHYILGNPPTVVEKAASKAKADPAKPAPATPVEKGSKTTTVSIDFELINTMFMTLISINKPELLDVYKAISANIVSANNQQEEYKKRNKPAPSPKKSSAKSVNPVPSASAEAIASATGN